MLTYKNSSKTLDLSKEIEVIINPNKKEETISSNDNLFNLVMTSNSDNNNHVVIKEIDKTKVEEAKNEIQHENDNKSKKDKAQTAVTKFRKKLSSPMKQILLWYLIITMFGAMMLSLSITKADNYTENIEFIDALFISASAFSDTGLSTIDISIAFNMFGQSIIAVLIIVGGIGWFGLKLFVIQIFVKKAVSHKSLNILNSERGYSTVGRSFSVIKVAIVVQIFAIAIVGSLLTISFMHSTPTDTDQFIMFFENNIYANESGELVNNTWVSDSYATFVGGTWIANPADYSNIIAELSPEGDVSMSMRNGFFISISAVNNAGFDIIASNSITPYILNYDIQIMLLFLFILGGIGFPLIYDLKQWYVHRKKDKIFRFSLLTKVSIASYVGFSLFIWATTLLFDMAILNDGSFDALMLNGMTDHKDTLQGEHLNTGEEVWVLTFLSFSTRNAGFTTVDLGADYLSQGTLFIFMFSMFIGSSPSSTTGGIRNTTFAVLLMSFFSFSKGRERVTMFKKTISAKQIKSAFSILFLSMAIVIFSILITATSMTPDGDIGFVDIMFESFSAFGTTGLSTGITNQLNVISKLMIILVMFIGQLGISTLISQFTPSEKKYNNTHFPEEDIELG